MPDISNLNFTELAELKNAVVQRMKDMRDTGITQLRATIAEQAQLLDVDLKDLLPKKPRKQRKRADNIQTTD
ncbi:MAG: hypothetical protein ACRD9W_20420 [Terriglobia bacterium]